MNTVPLIFGKFNWSSIYVVRYIGQRSLGKILVETERPSNKEYTCEI